MHKMFLRISLLITSLALYGQDQVVGPMSDRVNIPVQGAGNTAGFLNDGNLTDLSGKTGSFANGEEARIMKEMALDSVRNSKVGLFGRPSSKMGWIKTLNRIMEKTHDVCDQTADYIEQVRTAKSRLKKTMKSFEDGFTGVWDTLKSFKISDIWDFRRKWSRSLENEFWGLRYEAWKFESWLYDINATREDFIQAYSALWGNPEEDENVFFFVSFPPDSDKHLMDVKLAEHSAIRSLLIGRSVDSLMRHQSDSKWNALTGFVAKVTFNEDLSDLENLSDIEIDVARAAAALKNDRNGYSDYLVIKTDLDRLLMKLDRNVAILQQNEALMKASELKLMNRTEYARAVAESKFINQMEEGALK